MKKQLPLLIIITLVGVAVVSDYRGARAELSTAKREYVYQICNSARQEVNGQSEQECGRAQDRTGTEFLCEQRNADPSNHCWVEEK